MILRNLFFAFIALIFFSSSCSYPHTREYRQQYAHVKKRFTRNPSLYPGAYSITFLVDAQHLDYSDSQQLVSGLAKRLPFMRTTTREVGHAWIRLQGKKDGEQVYIEGGHSGEWGVTQPTYCNGIMNYIQYGYANPNEEQKKHPRIEKNPIKYLWTTLYDGRFEKGSGGHRPTFAAIVPLSEEQFLNIYTFIQPENYLYSTYALTGNQCSSFVAQVAALIDIPLEHTITLAIDPFLKIAGKSFPLWSDPKYATLTLSSPDVLEKSLMQAVREGRAQYALQPIPSIKK